MRRANGMKSKLSRNLYSAGSGSPPVPDHEIMAHGFFALDALPEDTGAAARARIAEVIMGAPVSPRW